MSPGIRALIIAMIGPALQAAGVAWDLLDHGVFARGGLEHITLEHIVAGPAHLLMATGFMVAVFCIPVSLRVAVARPEEIELPLEEMRREMGRHAAEPAK